MLRRVVNSIGTFGQLAQDHTPILTSMTKQSGVVFTQSRNIRKHWDPKFKKLRKEKVIKIKLPDYQTKPEDLTPEQIRSKLKEEGLQPARQWIERQFYISNTGSVFEPYVPPEGDGKFSIISATGAKQKVEFMTKKGKSYLAVRKIKSYDDEFSIGEFEDEAQKIYVKAHEAIANKDDEALRLLVTEKAFPEVKHNTTDKTIRWKFIKTLEMPRAVHARCTDIVTKENVFSQITVRFHTQQTLAVYDRFGRLMHGSEIIAKDVLEYVVFEKHMAHQYGIWRIHAKIIPPWMPQREFSERTFIENPEPQPESSVPSTSDLKSLPPSSDSTAAITAS